MSGIEEVARWTFCFCLTAVLFSVSFAGEVKPASACVWVHGFFGPTWSPDGRRITFYQWNQGHAQIFDVGSGGDRPRSVVAGGAPAWSRDGTKLAFFRRLQISSAFPSPQSDCGPPTQSDLFVIGANGKGERNLTNSPTNEQDPAWSPDGRAIAFAAAGNAYEWDLYVMSANGGAREQLTSGPGADFSPSWAPDGRRILFSRADAGEVLVINRDGTGLQKLGNGQDPVWSPDGSKIAFGSPSGEIVVVRADGRSPTSLGPGQSPAWSPDGKRITFVNERPFASSAIYAMNSDGSSRRRITPGLIARSFWTSPKAPRAGRKFGVTLDVELEDVAFRSEVRGKHPEGRVLCLARIRRGTLPALARSFSAGAGRCAWRIPRSARGKRIAGSITALALDDQVTRKFSFIVR